MKLLIKIKNANDEVDIIDTTLNSPMPPSSNDFGNLTPIKAIKINKVNVTEMWANNLFRDGLDLAIK